MPVAFSAPLVPRYVRWPSRWKRDNSIADSIIQRYVLVVDNGKVTHVAVEQNPGEVTVTAANVILAQL